MPERGLQQMLLTDLDPLAFWRATTLAGHGGVVARWREMPAPSHTPCATAPPCKIMHRAEGDATSDAPEFDDRLGGGPAVGHN